MLVFEINFLVDVKETLRQITDCKEQIAIKITSDMTSKIIKPIIVGLPSNAVIMIPDNVSTSLIISIVSSIPPGVIVLPSKSMPIHQLKTLAVHMKPNNFLTIDHNMPTNAAQATAASLAPGAELFLAKLIHLKEEDSLTAILDIVSSMASKTSITIPATIGHDNIIAMVNAIKTDIQFTVSSKASLETLKEIAKTLRHGATLKICDEPLTETLEIAAQELSPLSGGLCVPKKFGPEEIRKIAKSLANGASLIPQTKTLKDIITAAKSMRPSTTLTLGADISEAKIAAAIENAAEGVNVRLLSKQPGLFTIVSKGKRGGFFDQHVDRKRTSSEANTTIPDLTLNELETVSILASLKHGK